MMHPLQHSPLRLIAIATLILVSASAVPAGLSRHGAHAATGPPDAAQMPDTPVSAQLAWVLGVLNGAAGSLTEADATARFAPAILTVLPPHQLIGVLQQLAMTGPLEIRGFTRQPTATQAIALLAGAGGVPFVLPVAVEVSAPHRITGMNLAPVPPPAMVDLEPFTEAGAEAPLVTGMVDIGGRQIYLTCRGIKGPTVVLESGGGDGAGPWFAVESGVAKFSRVCSYDRANTLGGASDPAPSPRTGMDVVADLHALLRVAGVPGPYVLVGHSFGGHVVRLFAAKHPEEVAGLVLVDASHEGQAPLLGIPDESTSEAATPEPIAPPQLSDLEGIDREATAAQVRSAAPPQTMPLVVITAGRGFDEVELSTGVSATALAQLWRDLQAGLARIVPGGRQVIAERSGHYIHQTEPGLVVDAIREVIEAVRRQETAHR